MVPILQNKMRVIACFIGRLKFVVHDTVTIPYLTVVRNTVAN